jgi:inward rectifier potassium channel
VVVACGAPELGRARAPAGRSGVANRRPEDDIVVVGARAHPLRDAYHLLLRMRWPWALATIAGSYLAINALFALAYVRLGGIAGAHDGSFKDAFYFSVQTMGTIGYGAMYPATDAANTLVIAESVVGLILTALATGIVFARFSQTSSQLVFSEKAAIAPMNGVPTLSFRIGNDRASTIVEAVVRVALIRTEKTAEGKTLYRILDLELSRDRSPALSRSWTVMHPITEKSPLFGRSPEACGAEEIELLVSVVGTDDTSLQPVHGRHRYLTEEIVWGAHLSDVLTELDDGRLRLDLTRFHALEPSEPTEGFPYPRKAG